MNVKLTQLIRSFILLAIFFMVFLVAFNPDYIRYLIFFTCVIAFALVLYLISPRIFDKEFFKVLGTIIIAGIVISFGFYTYGVGVVEENEISNLKYGYYPFSIIPSGMYVSIDGFRLTVDYTQNTGNITFYISGEEMANLTDIQINVPPDYNITSIKLEHRGGDYRSYIEGKNYNKIYYQESYYGRIFWNNLNVRDFNNLSKSEDVGFSVFFNAINSTNPNGKFRLSIDSKRVYTYNFDRKIIFFVLGEYSCKNPCQGDVKDSILSFDNNMLSASYPDNYYELYQSNPTAIRPLNQEFGLNMQNNVMVKAADRDNQMGIGLIVSGIVIYIQSIVEAYTFILYNRIPEKINKNRKRTKHKGNKRK